MILKTIYEIDKEAINDLFSSTILYRGEEYGDEGLVESIEPLSSTCLTGIVKGTYSYMVSITIDEDGEILCDCSCPCDFNCKHAAALLLQWITIKDKKSAPVLKTKNEHIETLDQILIKKTKADLIFLIKQFIKQYPELSSYVHFDVHKLTFNINRLFLNIWDWNDSNKLICEIDRILHGIQSNKKQWDKKLVEEMKKASQIMVDNVENIDYNSEFLFYLDEWFLTYGEIFSATKPTKKQKSEFIQSISQRIKEDDYDLDYTYQKALLGMCVNEKDLDLIINVLKSNCEKNYSFDENYSDLVLQIYDKLGLHERYIDSALKSNQYIKAIDKLIQLEKYEEALGLCEQFGNDSINLILKKASLLIKLGKTQEWHQCLLMLIQKTWQYSYVPQLKKASKKDEWKTYRKEIIENAKKTKQEGFLSRLYYDEKNYKEAYAYAQEVYDEGYLELLAKKLSKKYPLLACNILKKLCFDFVNKGSGWPYKKTGSLLKDIKKIDKAGSFFRQTKKQLIKKHEKKYSLMKIIDKI